MVPARLTATLLVALLTAPAAAYDLSQHLWRERLLIIAGPAPDDPVVQRVLEVVDARAAAVADRDLRVFELYPGRGALDGRPLGADAVASLRRRFAVDPQTRALLLIGKDGGIKRQAPLDTALSEIFGQIDAMPMRQAEIRAKRAAGLPVTPP